MVKEKYIMEKCPKFHKNIDDLESIEVKNDDDDKALLLLI